MNKNQWNWPAELDALTADPEHHTLLLENEFVRVLDTCISPGELTEIHTHQFPATLYIKSWSDFIRYNPEGNILFDSRTIDKPPIPTTAIWSNPLPPHQLENIGTGNLHVLTVEIKKL
jgi:hypothetical protein